MHGAEDALYRRNALKGCITLGVGIARMSKAHTVSDKSFTLKHYGMLLSGAEVWVNMEGSSKQDTRVAQQQMYYLIQIIGQGQAVHITSATVVGRDSGGIYEVIEDMAVSKRAS